MLQSATTSLPAVIELSPAVINFASTSISSMIFVPGFAITNNWLQTSVNAGADVAFARRSHAATSPPISGRAEYRPESRRAALYGDPELYLRRTLPRRADYGCRGDPYRRFLCRRGRDIKPQPGAARARLSPYPAAAPTDLRLRRRCADVQCALERRRQQLHGLRHRQHHSRPLRPDPAGQSRHRPQCDRHRWRLHVLNPQTGNEFPAALDFTYNFENVHTQYQNGIDMHLDVSASHFVSKEMFSASATSTSSSPTAIVSAASSRR
jgi:hypothetical protein